MEETKVRTTSINPNFPYTIPEVARIVNVHADTVRSWCDQGKIGYSKLGYRTIRILGQDIIDFLNNNRENPTCPNNSK